MKFRNFTIIGLLFLFLISCTKRGEDFSTSACTQGNLNCDLPSMQVEVVGTDNSTQTNVGNNDAAGNIEIKSIRFGEKAIIEFSMRNPKLSPLRDFTFAMSPGDTSFTVINSTRDTDCSNSMFPLLYNQKCVVTIEYKPTRTPPPLQNLSFKFKTLLGAEFTFTAQFDPATLLPDFYIDDSYLTFPETLIYNTGAVAGTEIEIPIENPGTDTDLTLVQFLLNGSSEWKLGTASTNPCTQGQTLTKRGGICNIKVIFTPLSAGSKSTSLILLSGGNARSYILTGLAKSVSPSLNTLDFGPALLNSPNSTQTLTLSFPTSSGNPASSSCTYSLTGDSAFAISSNSCGATQSAGSSCAISFQWTPSFQVTDHVGHFSWTCDTRGGNSTVLLTAKSVNSPLVTDKTIIDFGKVLIGTTPQQTIKFKNLGSLGLLSNFTRSLVGTAFSSPATTCTTSMTSSGECDYVIQFTPNTTSVMTGTLTAATTQTTMDYAVSIQGTGIAVTPSLNTIDFGLVGIGNDRPGTTIALTNPSTVDTATGCQLNYADALTQNFSLDSDSTCINKLTLLPGESCSIKSRFTPALPEGSRNANITYTCTVGDVATVILTGTSAIETRLVVAPPSHLYINDHLVGTSNDIEFLLLNEHATEVAPLLSITTPDIGFGWTIVAASANDCSGFTQLTPGASCRVRLRSTPSAAAGAEQAGEFTGRLAVSADHGNIDPPDGYYTSNNKMIVADYSSYTFDSISVNSDGISNPISVTNPSGLDSASGCSLAVSAGFEILSTTCSSSGLAPLSLCTTRIRVPAVSSPTTLTGNLDYTCTVGGRARIPLTVKVEPLPNFLWSGSTHFGSMDTSAPAMQRTYTLTNNDSSAIELTSVSLSGGDSSFSVVSKTCNTGGVLAPSASCVVIISFDSSDENVHYATLEAYARRSGSTNPPELSSLSIDGSGSHMTLTISSSSLTFDDKELGSATTENKTFSITNDGTRTANLTYSSLSSPFTNTGTGTCGASLSAGASCTVILQMSAAGSIGTSNTTLTITETSNGVSNNSTVNLTGRTVAVADLAIKDDVTNTTYSSGITTTDITGTVGNARNITDRSPSSKIVTYTIKNNVTSAGDIVLSNAILNYKSGSTGTMAISTNTCDGATLSSESTCVISVTYIPTADHDTSTFELSLSGNSLGRSLSVAVTNIVGSSFKSPSLSISSSSITMTTTRKGATSSTELSLTNNGDYNASLDTFLFSGTDSGYFAKANGITSPNCGATLAAGASCYFKINFSPTVASAMQTTQTVGYSYVVGSGSLSSSVAAGVTAASYATLTAAGAEGFANDDSALEPEIASDGNRIYISSTQSLDNTEAYPIVTVCDLAAKGYVDQDTSKCTQNIFKIGTTKNLLAGTFGGARPKIAVTTNHIFLAVNNQDTNYSGDVLNGSSTIIICNKPGVGTRTISFSTDCYVNPIHTSGARSGSGTFPSMVISGNKMAFANAISNAFKKGFIITVCDFDDTQSTPSAVLTLATCVYHTEDLGDTDRSQMGHLAFNNSKLIYAAYNKKAGEESLAAIACAVNASDNAITCGSYSAVTNQILDGSLYPGAYPSVAFDGTSGSGGGSGDGAHFYVAHQQGETTFHYLRLSDCTLNASSGGNGFSCSTQTIASHTGIAGLGMVPRLSLVGTGPGARLWISYIGSSNESVWTDAYSEIRYCTIQNLSPPTCGASPYFTLPYSISAEIPTRGHIIDATNNVMIIPQITGSLNRIGTVSVGLTPEL